MAMGTRNDRDNRSVKFYAEKYGRRSLTPGIYFRATITIASEERERKL